MKEKKVYTEKVKNNYIDTATGEVISTDVQVKHHKVVVPTKEAFAFQYAAIIGELKELSGRDIKVLTYCAINASTETNELHLTSTVLGRIAEEFGSTVPSIRNSVSALAKKQILIPIKGGSYAVNPKYYWKGTINGRSKVLKYVLTLEYNEQENGKN